MTKAYFDANVLMGVEIEYDMGGRCWHTVKGAELKSFIDNIAEGEWLSDVDYCAQQDDEESQKILDKAFEIFYADAKKFGTLDAAIDSLLEQPKAKRVWTEEEIKTLIQTNDKALYGALRMLYAEQADGETSHKNGAGFNSADARIMSSFAEFLARAGFLTTKQKVLARKKLIKYNKQLTRLANA